MSYRLFYLAVSDENLKEPIVLDLKCVEAIMPIDYQNKTYTKVFMKSNSEWLLAANFYEFQQLLEKENN